MNKSLLTITALFIATLPYAAHAQGTIRGAEEVRPQATERQGHSGLLLVEPSVPPPVPSAASWASRSGPGFASTSYVNTALRSDTKAMCASARCFHREA